MKNDIIINYDLKFFKFFKNVFSAKFKDKFVDEKLYDTNEKRCNFLFNFFKVLSKKLYVKKAISLFLDFIMRKKNKSCLEYFSTFDCEIFNDYKKEMLIFRNTMGQF